MSLQPTNKSTNQQTTQQLNILSDWGIVKRFRRYHAASSIVEESQVIDIDQKHGTGFFEVHDFGNISLSKVNCQFNQAHNMSNQQAKMAYILYFALEGDFKFTVHATTHPNAHTRAKSGDKTYHVVAPSLWLLRAATHAVSTTISANKSLKAFQIALTDDFVQQLIEQLGKTTKYQHSLLEHFILQDTSEVHFPFSNPSNKLFQQAWELYKIPAPQDELAFMALKGAVYTFFNDLVTKPYTHLLPNTANIPSYAVQAKLLIDQFYHQNWSTRELAKKVGTNESYLKQHFKALTGQSLNHYRTEKRMHLAQEMLDKGMASYEVAYQLGYNSHQYFKKVWQEHQKK